MTAKNKECLECGNPVVIKGLCRKHYRIQYRKTPSGKAATKRYNATKGKEAQARYMIKRGIKPKPPKEIKPCAECPKTAEIAGYCKPCYHRNYQKRKKTKPEGTSTARGPKPIPQVDIDNMFKSVLENVQAGSSIQRACKKAGIVASYMYKKISDLQKNELRAAKAIGNVNARFN